MRAIALAAVVASPLVRPPPRLRHSFWFTHAGVLHSWQVKDLPKGERAVTRMANEAIAAGPR